LRSLQLAKLSGIVPLNDILRKDLLTIIKSIYYINIISTYTRSSLTNFPMDEGIVP